MMATEVVLLLQVPPIDVSVSVVEDPVQTASVPPIGLGWAFTVTVVAEEQPVDVCVNVMDAVPTLLPVTIPVDDPTSAIVVFDEDHVPVTFVSVVVLPMQIVIVPPDAAGNALTVIVAVTDAVPQPLETV
jgi:hypothetical protein